MRTSAWRTLGTILFTLASAAPLAIADGPLDIERDYCARPKADARAALEAVDCVDCSTQRISVSTGLSDVAEQAKDARAAANAAAEGTKAGRIKRELAFFRFLEKAAETDATWTMGGQDVKSLKEAEEHIGRARENKAQIEKSIAAHEKLIETIDSFLPPLSSRPPRRPPPETARKLASHLDARLVIWKKLLEETRAALVDVRPSEQMTWGGAVSIDKVQTEMKLKDWIRDTDDKVAAAEAVKRWLNTDTQIDDDSASIAMVALKADLEETRLQLQTMATAFEELEEKIRRLEALAAMFTLRKQPAAAKSEEEILRQYEAGIQPHVVSREKVETCGMSDAELFALKLYSANAYVPTNAALRSGAAATIRPFVDVLTAALEKLKPYDGLVMRGAKLPADRLAQHAPGAELDYPAFTSTSLGNGFQEDHTFVIRSKKGRFIGAFSTRVSEREVLMMPGTRFKVLERMSPASEGRNHFVMEEIE